ncbi:5343_t:CDS:2 [Rhizophagus irregularis]|nr:5343_t:CDS:2 [Rhizophagus irregularis]
MTDDAKHEFINLHKELLIMARSSTSVMGAITIEYISGSIEEIGA